MFINMNDEFLRISKAFSIFARRWHASPDTKKMRKDIGEDTELQHDLQSYVNNYKQSIYDIDEKATTLLRFQEVLAQHAKNSGSKV